MTTIKFGTDSWETSRAEDVVIDNVQRLAEGRAKWLLTKVKHPSVMIGHDSRFGGELYVKIACKVFLAHGIKVYLSESEISGPMMALGIVKKKADLGVVITFDHTSHACEGFKIKDSYGSPLLQATVNEIETFIPGEHQVMPDKFSLKHFEEIGLVEYIELEKIFHYQDAN